MHTTIDTEKLQTMLEITSRVSTKHLTLPVLQCVLLEAADDSVVLKATNLEIGIEGNVPATVTQKGTIAVPAQTLLQTINLITQKKTTLKAEGDVLMVEAGHSQSKIKSISSEEFPRIPHITKNKQAINGTLFATGIQTVAFTASQSSIKPELGSVYIYQKKAHTLTFVATDSFRLMEKTMPQQGLVLQESILIPYRNAIELARVVEKSEENTTLFIDENQCALQTDSIYITSRLTSGTFPDYEQIIPKEYQTHATVLTSDLSHALKKTNIFLNKFMQLTLAIGGESLTLSSESSEVGTTTEKINASVDGEPITLNFNQRYISEVMAHIIDDSVTLHFAGIGRPMVLESVHDKTLRYLVMPMNK